MSLYPSDSPFLRLDSWCPHPIHLADLPSVDGIWVVSNWGAVINKASGPFELRHKLSCLHMYTSGIPGAYIGCTFNFITNWHSESKWGDIPLFPASGSQGLLWVQGQAGMTVEILMQNRAKKRNWGQEWNCPTVFRSGKNIFLLAVHKICPFFKFSIMSVQSDYSFPC